MSTTKKNKKAIREIEALRTDTASKKGAERHRCCRCCRCGR